MRLRILAAGQRMPAWIQQGYKEYAQRMPRECVMELQEIPLGRRAKSLPVERARDAEGERMLAAMRGGEQIVTLEVSGRQLTTENLSTLMGEWMQGGRDLCFLIGGPDGLAPSCLDKSQLRWSLSELTLPHGLVRVLLAEQLYRAWTLLKGHPYHRA